MGGKTTPTGLTLSDVLLYNAPSSKREVRLWLSTDTAKKRLAAWLLLAAVLLAAVVCLFVGSSGMTVTQCLQALAGRGSDAHLRIIWNIRLPLRAGAIIAGAGCPSPASSCRPA